MSCVVTEVAPARNSQALLALPEILKYIRCDVDSAWCDFLATYHWNPDSWIHVWFPMVCHALCHHFCDVKAFHSIHHHLCDVDCQCEGGQSRCDAVPFLYVCPSHRQICHMASQITTQFFNLKTYLLIIPFI